MHGVPLLRLLGKFKIFQFTVNTAKTVSTRIGMI